DRVTGQSLFPLTEKAAFPSDIPGEQAAVTQIQPELPAPFMRLRVTAETLTQRTPAAASAVAAQFATLRSRGLWDPPSEQGTVVFPGLEGASFGGGAFDPKTGFLYVNASEMPWILKLKKSSQFGGSNGGALYRENCAGCHGL